MTLSEWQILLWWPIYGNQVDNYCPQGTITKKPCEILDIVRGMMSHSGDGQPMAFFAPTTMKGTLLPWGTSAPYTLISPCEVLKTTYLCVTMKLFPLSRATIKKVLEAFQQVTVCPYHGMLTPIVELKTAATSLHAYLRLWQVVISTGKRHFL